MESATISEPQNQVLVADMNMDKKDARHVVFFFIGMGQTAHAVICEYVQLPDM